jgi:ABC-type amino acid transport substrate-binding protein
MIGKRMLAQILFVLGALCAWSGSVSSAGAQQASWTQIGMLGCKVDPSIGFVIFGHQSMSCRFTQNPPFPTQLYEGALNTVGIDIGVTAGGALAWAVLAPSAGPPAGALAGEYVGASGDIALGLGAGVNVLVGGSGRSFALQPVSVEGSVAIDVTVGLSGLHLRPVY